MQTENKAEVVVYGAMWCGDCRRAKRFFDTNGVAYQWFDVEQQPELMDEVMRLSDGRQSIPVIVFPDKSILIEPNNGELAEKLGIVSPA